MDRDALTNVKCTRMTADMVLAAGAPAVQMTITVKRPNLMLTEANSQGHKTVSGYDGATAWSVNPATGETQVMTLDSGTSANLSLFGIDAIIGSLRGLLAGQKAELVGSETVDGASAWHIRATRSDGVVIDYYVNGTTFLLGKTATQLPQQTDGQLLESYPADYRSTSGVTLWYSLDIRAARSSVMQLKVQQLEINPSVDDGVFKMPAPKTAPKE